MQAHDIANIQTWKDALGLLPVPLFKPDETKRFVLLNGIVGNFCLDLQGESDPEMSRSHAWSSDVGHYISLVQDVVEICRWDSRRSAFERFSKRSVQEKLGKFHEYLQRNQPDRALSIVTFAERVNENETLPAII